MPTIEYAVTSCPFSKWDKTKLLAKYNKCDSPPQTSSKVGPWSILFYCIKLKKKHIFRFKMILLVSSSYDTQKCSYDSSKHGMSEYVKPRKRALKFSVVYVYVMISVPSKCFRVYLSILSRQLAQWKCKIIFHLLFSLFSLEFRWDNVRPC